MSSLEKIEVLLPVADIRFNSSTRAPKETIVKFLEEIGFIFQGDVDEFGRKKATLPPGWSIAGDTDSTYWNILDEQGRKRLEVVKKVPWGVTPGRDSDFIHFSVVIPGAHNAVHPRDGW